VWGVAPDGVKPVLAIFGEAPGKDEDREKTPFIGGSGSVLNWALAEVKVRRVNCYIGNVISCRPPDNEITSIEGQDAIPLCRGGFFEDLTYLARMGCTTVIALGNTAMNAFGIEGSITKNRGSVYTYKFGSHTFTVIPTFHPSFIMRKHWKLDGGGNGDNGAAWIADFRKAASIANGGWEALKEDFNIAPTVEEVEEYVEKMVSKRALIAVDTETTGLDSNARIVVIGLADSKEHGVCVPILGLHGIPFYPASVQPRIKAALQKLFLSNPLLFQNCFFDIPMLQRAGYEFNLDNVEDTLLLHHTLSPESEHNLGFIVSVYGKTPYWKSEFLNRTTSILEMDQTSMRTYNLRDCVVLHQVYESMNKDLAELDMQGFYETEVKPLLAPVLEMRNTGMLIDLKAMGKFKTELERKRASYREELYHLSGLPYEFNFDSDAELRYFLFGEVPSKFSKLEEFQKSNSRVAEFEIAGKKLLEEKAEKEASLQLYPQMPPKLKAKLEKKISILGRDAEKRFEQAKRVLNGQKFQELRRLFVVQTVKPLYVLTSYKPLATETDLAAVDAEGLLSYRIALNNRLRDAKALKNPPTEEITSIEKLLQWLAIWHNYSQVDKLLTTYCKYSPDPDGRIRPNWKAWGTATGRLSCSSPNLMNLPKRKDDDEDPANAVREFFVSRPGWKFVSCDYMNLEVYILAYETLDPDLLAVTSQGLNIHDINTRALFDITPADAKWKLFRAAAKIFQFGRLQYGGSDYGVYRKVMLKVPDMHLTGREFAQASARWMALHPAYVQWKNALEEEVKATRRIKTAFGRLRLFLGNEEGIIREALSEKIQSSGASLVNRAMRRIYDERNNLGLRARFVCQVHDQLIMEAPDEEVDQVKAIMVSQMEKPFEYKGFQRIVKVDPSVGSSFGEL